jgi:uracil-DNA glycosylase
MAIARRAKNYPHSNDGSGSLLEHLKRALEAGAVAGLEPPPLGVRVRRLLEAGPAESLDSLRLDAENCRKCNLWRKRKKVVFGEGHPAARLVFVGEAPGREEDLEGRPFVGEAGKMLTSIITKVMGLSRDEVYICNVLKCRPPGNRDPEPDEIGACIAFLRAQLSLINPEVICVLGRVAGTALLGKSFKITRDRGRWYDYHGIPVMPTFHPAYILRALDRQRELKLLVWEDVKQIMKRLGLEEK